MSPKEPFLDESSAIALHISAVNGSFFFTGLATTLLLRMAVLIAVCPSQCVYRSSSIGAFVPKILQAENSMAFFAGNLWSIF